MTATGDNQQDLPPCPKCRSKDIIHLYESHDDPAGRGSGGGYGVIRAGKNHQKWNEIHPVSRIIVQ